MENPRQTIQGSVTADVTSLNEAFADLNSLVNIGDLANFTYSQVNNIRQSDIENTCRDIEAMRVQLVSNELLTSPKEEVEAIKRSCTKDLQARMKSLICY